MTNNKTKTKTTQDDPREHWQLRITIITFIVTLQLRVTRDSIRLILAHFHSYLHPHFHSAFWGKSRSQNLDENSTTSNSTPKIHFPFSCFWLRIEIFGRFVLTFGVWLNFFEDFFWNFLILIELFGGFFKTLVFDWNVLGFFKTCCFGLKCLEDFLKFVLLDRNVWAFFKTCCFGLKCLEDFLKLFWLFIEIWFHLCFCCVFNNKLRYLVWVQKSRFIYIIIHIIFS